MPIFEYVCEDCGAEFETLVKNAASKVECPKCGKKKVERKLSVFSASVARQNCPSASSCPSAGKHGCGHSGSCGCGMPH